MKRPVGILKLWRRRLLYVTGIGLVVFAAISWQAGSILIRPARTSLSMPDGMLVEEMEIASQSGATIAGWYLPNVEASATVLLFHPVRGNRTHMLERAKLLHGAGFAIVLIDLQAHGESSGDQITFGFRERHDVRATIDFVRITNPTHKIGIVGWSLGGAATLLAQPDDIDAVVLESVYPTIEEAVNNRLKMRVGMLHHLLSPILLWQLSPRLGIRPKELRPIDQIQQLNCPVLVLSGELDEHTTIDETKRLYDAASQPKQLVVFAGAKHEDLFKFAPKQYERDVVSFLKTNLSGE